MEPKNLKPPTLKPKNAEFYKETELGILPENWDIKKIGTAYEFSSKPRNLNKNNHNKIPFIPMEYISAEKIYVNDYDLRSPNDINSGSFFLKNDLLVAKITPSFENGKQCIVKDLPLNFGYATTEIWPLHGKPESDILFLFYYLKMHKIRNEIAGKMEGSTGRQRVPKNVLNDFKIALPPLAEQKKIVEVLSKVHKTIEKTEAVIESSIYLKKTMMKYLFSYGSVPLDESKNVLLQETQFGMVPEDWKTAPLEKIADVSYGIQASVSQNTDPSIGLPILTNVNITFDGVLDLSELKYYDLSQKKKGKKYLLQKGDVLFNWRSGSKSHVGKTAYFDLDSKMVCSSFILRIRSLDNEKLNSRYIFYYLSFLRNVIHYFENITDYLINAKFNASHAKKVPILIPNISVQKQIVDCLVSIDTKIQFEKNRKENLEKLFHTLLNNLMTAKTRVNHLEV